MATPPVRPDLYVVARFLDRLREAPRWTHGKLQPAVGLNYDLYQAYLAWLESKGFAIRVEEDGRETVSVTQAGLDAHTHLCGWIARVLGDAALMPRRPPGR